MFRSILISLVSLLLVLGVTLPLHADYPSPSPYPVSWELDLTYQLPKRILVDTGNGPKAYWYFTYHVTNNTDRDKVMFYPSFDMMTAAGTVVRSDNNISPKVFQAIKDKEHIKYLQDANSIGGELLQGEDQSRDGVAIWPEPDSRMGSFTIFASGFWGEAATVKVGDKETIVHKTLQNTYHLDADSANADSGQVKLLDSEYVMR